jgi:hypothetical protein
MTEIFLIVVLAILVLGFILYVVVTQGQVMKLTQALMAKNLTEYKDATTKTPEQPVVEDKEPDVIPLESLDQEEFMKIIEGQTKQ